jgi:hypothetical protein
MKRRCEKKHERFGEKKGVVEESLSLLLQVLPL